MIIMASSTHLFIIQYLLLVIVFFGNAAEFLEDIFLVERDVFINMIKSSTA